MKLQDDILSWNIILIVAKFQGPKFRKKGNISKSIIYFFFNFSIYHPISADTSLKFLSLILFEIRHLQNCIPLFVKGP